MKKKFISFLSIILVLAMVFTTPLATFANEAQETNVDAVVKNTTTNTLYEDVIDGLLEAAENETVVLLEDAKVSMVTVPEAVTLDLNGYALTASYVTCFGNIVDNSEDNNGMLNVSAKRFLIQENNEQLPVREGNGYRFFDVTKFNTRYLKDTSKYVFQPFIESGAHSIINSAKELSGVTINVRVSWTQNEGVRTQDFVYTYDKVEKFLNSYVAGSTEKYNQMFTLVLAGTENFEDISFSAVVVSDTGVEIKSDAIVINKKGNVSTDENNQVIKDVTLQSGQSSAVVNQGTQLEEDTTDISLTVKEMDVTNSDIPLGEDEEMLSVDVHVEGIAPDNTVPVIITIDKLAPEFMNQGNITLYHVENGVTIEMTRVYSLEEVDAHNEYYYDIATGTVTMALARFSEIAVLSNAVNPWNGNSTVDWYAEDPDAEVFEIYNADQLVGLGKLVGGMEPGYDFIDFYGKTIKLLADINLADDEAHDDYNKIFYPIGYYITYDSNEDGVAGDVYSTVSSFEGTFDGMGHTISNFYQNTWDMTGDYNDGYAGTPNYYKDAMGLFGYVVDATIENLNIKNFSSDGEFTPTGVIAAYAENSTFKNISITNCNPRVYNTGNGGIVGIGGRSDDTDACRLVFENITIDNSNKITALWGSWDVACGGLMGMFRGNGYVDMINCHVAAQIDVYNDVCGNYQYYWYRYAGMLIGTNKNMTTDANGYTVPETSKYHATDCTVHFGDWNDYYYCELVANSLASYTHDHQFSRLTQVDSVDVANMTVTVDGTTTAIPDSGRYNYVVVLDPEHPGDETAECYHFVDGKVWNHEDAGYETTDVNGDGIIDSDLLKEDRQHYYLPFNQLFTGYGWGVRHIPLGEFDGVTVYPREVAGSVDKFKVKDGAKAEYVTDTTITAGELFEFVDSAGVPVDMDNVQITVSPWDETSTAGGVYVANETDWTQGTITFNGLGKAQIIITDYFYCNVLSIQVEVINLAPTAKFQVKDGAVTTYTSGSEVVLGNLFEATGEGLPIDSVTVTVTVDGANYDFVINTTDWTQGKVTLYGVGTAVISITDNNYCEITTITVNITRAPGSGGGVVLPDEEW